MYFCYVFRVCPAMSHFCFLEGSMLSKQLWQSAAWCSPLKPHALTHLDDIRINKGRDAADRVAYLAELGHQALCSVPDVTGADGHVGLFGNQADHCMVGGWGEVVGVWAAGPHLLQACRQKHSGWAANGGSSLFMYRANQWHLRVAASSTMTFRPGVMTSTLELMLAKYPWMAVACVMTGQGNGFLA